jgi:hypothetical protein
MDPRLALQQQMGSANEAFLAAAQRQQQSPNPQQPVFGSAPQGWQQGLKTGWAGGSQPPALGRRGEAMTARRNPNPAKRGPGGPPDAPGLSARMSPGTVPMKKGPR